MLDDISKIAQSFSVLVATAIMVIKFWSERKDEDKDSAVNDKTSTKSQFSTLRRINLGAVCLVVGGINIYSFIFGPAHTLPVTNGSVGSLIAASFTVLMGWSLMTSD